MNLDYKKRFIEQLEFLLKDWDDSITKTTEIVMTKETMQGLLDSLKGKEGVQ
jgi:hypothetical protein